MIGELHCHSCFSKPSLADFWPPSPYKVLKRAKELRLDFVAITDHDTLGGSIVAQKLANSLGILVIPAIEITTCPGGFFKPHPHILAYGLTRQVSSYQPVKETIDSVHNQGGIVAAAHPFCPLLSSRIGLKNDVRNFDFDLIEVFNSGELEISNKKAEELGKRLKIPAIAGSDAHFLGHLGKALVEIMIDKTERWQDLVAAMKKGKIRIIKKSSPPWSLFRRILYPLACRL